MQPSFLLLQGSINWLLFQDFFNNYIMFISYTYVCINVLKISDVIIHGISLAYVKCGVLYR